MTLRNAVLGLAVVFGVLGLVGVPLGHARCRPRPPIRSFRPAKPIAAKAATTTPRSIAFEPIRARTGGRSPSAITKGVFGRYHDAGGARAWPSFTSIHFRRAHHRAKS